MREKLATVLSEQQAAVVAEVIDEASRDLAKVRDIDEMRRLLCQLLETQQRSEQRILRLLDVQERIEQRIIEIADAHKQTAYEMQVLVRTLNEIRRDVGDLRRSVDEIRQDAAVERHRHPAV